MALLCVVRHSRRPLLGLPRACAPVVFRNATTVLSHLLLGVKFRAKLKEVFLKPLRCLNLGTSEHPFYHGQGWLPATLNRQVHVVTPVLNSGCHGGKWGLRYLSGREILLCKEVSVQQTEILQPEHSNDSFLAAILLGKSLVKGCRLLIEEGGSEDSSRLGAQDDSLLGSEDSSR